MALLYQCDENKSQIIHIWGTADPDKLASKDSLKELELYQSVVWKWVLQILISKIPSFDHTFPTHFHDYTNIESI
jgi:hypothetical protein